MQHKTLPKEILKIVSKYPEWGPDVDLIIMPPLDSEIIEEFPESEYSDALKPYTTTFGVTRGALYCHLRRSGATHRMAEMVACQEGPSLVTDTTFKTGMKTIGDQFVNGSDHQVGVFMGAKAHGYTPRKSDTYFASLARFQGDPEAFVPASEGRGYIKNLCEKRGWACSGSVNVASREPEEDPRTEKKYLANDLVDANIGRMARKNPEVLRKSRKELRKTIIEHHGM